MSNVAKEVQEQYGLRKQGKSSDKNEEKYADKRSAKKCLQKCDFCGENCSRFNKKSVLIELKSP